MTAQDQIRETITKNDVVLFMKGTKMMPQCGFSSRVAGVLNYMGVEFADVNVLADAEIRQGIKDFSDWPTIPQLYVKGEFVGGCDIVTEMALSAERIHEERLSIYVKGVEHELYARKYLVGHDTYTFGEMLEGGSALHEAWRQLTGPQVLFLSQAVANSNEEINQLRKPFMWLSDDLMFESHGMRDSARYTQRLIADLPSIRHVRNILSAVSRSESLT